jgi:hypothetical protein
MTSKQVVLNTNQMAFFIYNLFGHDITHDGHPSGLGEGRFSSAIRTISDTAKGVMNTKVAQSGGEPQEELAYFQSIGEMTSRNTIIHSIGNELIEARKLFAANIPRNSNTEKVWQDISFIIININRIIENFNEGNYFQKDESYPGFVYFNNEVINPYDIVVSRNKAPGGLGGYQYIVSFPNKNFEVIITDSSIDSIQIRYETENIGYTGVTSNNFQQIINALTDEFFYVSFNDYMKNDAYMSLEGVNSFFDSYVLKKTSPTQNGQNFFSSIFKFAQTQNDQTFGELVQTFSIYKNDYDAQFNLYASSYFEEQYNEGIDLGSLAEIFVGQIQQLPSQFEMQKATIFNTIISFSEDQSNELIRQLSLNLQNSHPTSSDYINLLINFFVISRFYLNSNTNDFNDNDDNDDTMFGGAVRIPYEHFVVQPEFIEMVTQGFDTTQIEQILHPANIQQVVSMIESKFTNYTDLINNLLPRDILPLDYAQRLYGAETRPSLNINTILSFLIKSVPSDSDMTCLSELDKYKRFIFNDPTTVTEIKGFVEDLIQLFDNQNEINPDVILSLLIGFNSSSSKDKLISVFVENVSGIAQIATEKIAKKQIGILGMFEQYMIRQIRIAILYLLTPQIYNIPPNNKKQFFDNFTQSLNVYLKIINIITLLYESAPGLTTLQKINSAYMISTAIVAVTNNMKKITSKADYILEAQIKILSSIYLQKNVSSGKTGIGDIDSKLFTEFQKWISTGSKGAGNFAGTAGYIFNDKKLSEKGFWASLNMSAPFPENQLYYINNAVTAKVGIPPFFCPFSSIMDGQSTCNTLTSALKNNGVEYGTMDVIVRDGNVNGTTTGETMRYHIRVEIIPNTTQVKISSFLKIGNEVLINIGSLGSTPKSPPADPFIVVDLNSKRSPLEASECLREIINVNVNTLVNSDQSVKKWDDYLELINSNDTKPIVSLMSGESITPQELRRRIVSASFRKSLGDYLQELNMVVENGGYVSKPDEHSAPGTKIVDPNIFRLGLSNDRPSGIRIMLLLLFGQVGINPNSIGGFINPEGKYLIAIRNKKAKGGKNKKTIKKYYKKGKTKKQKIKKNKSKRYH